LRELDKLNYKLLICEGVNEQKMGISIMNRLKKSCANNIEVI
ncbi:MAG: Sua5 family C-terminal domain-containing protein, partial [Finegoldia magna]|nr:Sua5 family C-terminal domain-containing protein [Finegoldia magna]